MALTKVNSQLVDGAINTDASGNVGIGTDSPTQKLDVSGTIQSQYNAGSNDSVVGAYNFYNTNASASANPIRASVVAGRENSAWGAYLQFNTSTGTSAVAERMRIDSSGNLLVNGTTVYAKQTNFHNSSYVYASVSVGNNADHIIFKSDATTTGSITRVGGTGIAYNTSSDYRLKENIVPMTGALAKVQLLKPVTYSWKADGSNGEGFIAHELAEVIPQAVSGEKDAVEEDGSIKAQGVDYSKIVATLTAAIQELNAKVDAQALEIAILKAAK